MTNMLLLLLFLQQLVSLPMICCRLWDWMSNCQHLPPTAMAMVMILTITSPAPATLFDWNEISGR